MQFESRELKGYAEPVAPRKLQVGAVYFSLQFADPGLSVPILEPLVFIGIQRLDKTEYFVFEHYEAYKRGVKFTANLTKSRNHFRIQDRRNLNHIFEFDKALDLLLTCALKQKGAIKSQRKTKK
jgi:hypothetical protein